MAVSDAETEEAGYSPPVPETINTNQVNVEKFMHVPKPIIPRETVSIQNMPSIVTPCDAVARIPPITIIRVVKTMAALRPT